MPIDYKGLQLEKEKELNDLLARPSSPEGTIDRVRSSRAGFQDYLGGVAGKVSPSASSLIPEASRPMMGRLDRQANELQSKQGYQAKKARFNLVYDTAVKMATQYGLAYDEAVAFARQKALDDQRRTFQSSENALDRAYKSMGSGQAGYYSGKGLDIENKYSQPLTSPGEALTRVIAGTATGVGTAYALNRKKTPTVKTEIAEPFYDPSEFRR